MAIRSEFQKDISNMEKKIFGIGFRQFKAIVLIVPVCLIVITEVLFLPKWAFFILATVTSILLGAYPVLLFTDKWKYVKRKLDLYFMFEESTYLTGQIRRYNKDEFIQKNNIKETDKI